MTQMSISLAFAIGPWAGTAVLGAFGATTLWLAAFAVGLVSTGMMMRMPDNAPAAQAGQTAESPGVI